MATHKISIEGGASFECADDVYILDAADEAGVDLPYSCRAGACSTCAGKLVSGRSTKRIRASWMTIKLAKALLCCALVTQRLIV